MVQIFGLEKDVELRLMQVLADTDTGNFIAVYVPIEKTGTVAYQVEVSVGPIEGAGLITCDASLTVDQLENDFPGYGVSMQGKEFLNDASGVDTRLANKPQPEEYVEAE